MTSKKFVELFNEYWQYDQDSIKMYKISNRRVGYVVVNKKEDRASYYKTLEDVHYDYDTCVAWGRDDMSLSEWLDEEIERIKYFEGKGGDNIEDD